MPKIGPPRPRKGAAAPSAGEPWGGDSRPIMQAMKSRPAANQAPLPPKPAEQQGRYRHDPDDHRVFKGGEVIICLCVCDYCWPPEGGNCPDERRP